MVLIEPHFWFVESVATRLPARKPFGIAASSRTRLLLARVRNSRWPVDELPARRDDTTAANSDRKVKNSREFRSVAG
jgi:hypothetical protein